MTVDRTIFAPITTTTSSPVPGAGQAVSQGIDSLWQLRLEVSTLFQQAGLFARNFNGLDNNDIYNTTSGILLTTDATGNVRSSNPEYKLGGSSKGNAIGHAYASAVLAYRYGYTYSMNAGVLNEYIEKGPAFGADLLAALSKIGRGSPPDANIGQAANSAGRSYNADTESDLWNDEIGAVVGQYAKDHNLPPERVASLIKWAFDEGWMSVNPYDRQKGMSSDLVIRGKTGTIDDFKTALDGAAQTGADVGRASGSNVKSQTDFYTAINTDRFPQALPSLPNLYPSTQIYDYAWLQTQNVPVQPATVVNGTETTVVVVALKNVHNFTNDSSYGSYLAAVQLPDGSYLTYLVEKGAPIDPLGLTHTRIVYSAILTSAAASSVNYYYDSVGVLHVESRTNPASNLRVVSNRDGGYTIIGPDQSLVVAGGTRISVDPNMTVTVRGEDDSGTGAPLAQITVDSSGTTHVTTGASAPVILYDTTKLKLSAQGQLYGSIGSSIGSALGSFLSNGNQVEGVLYSSLFGQIGKGIALALDANPQDLVNYFNNTNVNIVDNFAGGLGAQLISGGAGLLSSTLTLDLANQLGITGFGAELLSTVASSTSSAVVTQVLNNLSNSVSPFFGFHGETLAKKGVILNTTKLSVVAENAIGSFLGAKLGALLVQPQNQAAALLSSIGSAVGSAVAIGAASTQIASFLGTKVGSLLFNIAAPGIGSLIGFVLGAVIGNLFGHKKPKIPSASASSILQLPYAQYTLGTVSSSNGGSTDVAVQMATTAAQVLNLIIGQIVPGSSIPHFVSNTTSPTQTYGYSGSQLYVTYNSVQHNVTSADAAVDQGVLWALPQTKIIGGDLFLKRAIAAQASADLTGLMGDLQTAYDYEKYSASRAEIDYLIKAAFGKLSQAERDFYDANKALVDQIDLSGTSSLSSQDLNTYNQNYTAINDLVAALQIQQVADPWVITLQRAHDLKLDTFNTSDFNGGLAGFIQSFTNGTKGRLIKYEDVSLGWDGTSLTIRDTSSNGQGVFSVLAQAAPDGASVTIASFNTLMSGSAQVGGNILIGGNSGNSLQGGSSDTWIQGGTGSDTLTGGQGHDVIVAGSGSTTIYGGANDSYLVGGAGTDNINGGAGNDTIALGSGYVTLAANGGDDIVVLNPVGGSGTLNGGAGTNTLSFEKFGSGVDVNLGAWTSPAGTSYTISNFANLIGAKVGDNTLRTAAVNATLMGGAGQDQFIGVAGGGTTVSFAQSSDGVTVNLASGASFGGAAEGDIFTNISNLIGSGFSDELTGVAGSKLNGGSGGNDWFDYSGGGNTYTGSANGANTLDYSLAGGALTIDLTAGTAQVSGVSVDTLSNITKVVGSRYGTTLTGLPAWTTTTANGVTTESGINHGIYFVAEGGTNTFTPGSYDTVEMNYGAGTATIAKGNHQTLAFGAGMTYDNLWVSYKSVMRNRTDPLNYKHYVTYSSTLNFGIRGSTEVATYTNVQSNLFATMLGINMDGASTLDLTTITKVVGPSTFTETGDSDPGDTVVDTTTGGGAAPLGANVTGNTTGGDLIIVGGGATTINVDGGSSTTNGSIVVAGRAAAGGTTINMSSGDDQITFERGDGHYILNGTGGQKTIDFGPTVGSSDVIYNIVGNDLYVGLQDSANSALTADQVADNIRIVNGALGSVISGAFTPNNPYFIQAGGTTVDLTKIMIGYKLNLATSQTFTANNVTMAVAGGLLETITGSGNTVNGNAGDTIKLSGTGSNNTVNMTGGTVNALTAGAAVTVSGNSNTITMTGSGNTVTVHGTGEVINTSNSTIYKGNTSTATINGTGNTVVTLGVAPIVLDLTGDGLELTPVSVSDVVTTASNGALTRLGWVGPTNGILVTDRNGDGKYGDVNDISFIVDKPGAMTDLEGLAGWDKNADGIVDTSDSGWSRLKVWVDSNLDGVSTSEEIKSLDSLGVVSISLQRILTGDETTVTSDSYASATSVFMKADGTSGKSYDVTLGQALLSDAEWTGQYGVAANQLSGGLLGHIPYEETDVNNVSYAPADSIDPSLASIWKTILHPGFNPYGAYDPTLGSGQAVATQFANRGAHLTVSRMQVLDLDLAGGGPEMIDVGASSVKQDVGLTGNPAAVGWVGATDGILVIDNSGDGNIDTPTEATFQSWLPYAKTSLQGLSAFDTNGNGTIDGEDAVYSHLRIWTDANSDGNSQSDELKSLTETGVRSIALEADWQTVDNKQSTQNQVLASTHVTMADGTTRTIYDVALGIQPDRTGDGAAGVAPPPQASPEAKPAASALAGSKAGDITDPGAPRDRLSTTEDDRVTMVATSRSSAGPSGEVMTSEIDDRVSTYSWWQGPGEGLGDAIKAFNGPAFTISNHEGPVATANDASMIQRHLLLRQAIAGFTVRDASPAVFKRQGTLDTQTTLAAATKSIIPLKASVAA